MPLIPSPIKERIHIYGSTGAGKSWDVFCIAQLLQETKSPGVVYILDTDGEAALVTHYGGFPTLTNVVVIPVRNWETLTTNLEKLIKTCKREDFIVIDLFCKTWEWVQKYYAEQVYKKDKAQFFLEAKIRMEKAAKSEQAFSGWEDWPYIKGLYASELIDPILYDAPCNTIAVSKAKLLDSKTEKDKRVLETFSRIGYRPEGNKYISHEFHSVLFKSLSVRTGAFKIDSIKDRTRVMLDQDLQHFGMEYLLGPAKWRLD